MIGSPRARHRTLLLVALHAFFSAACWLTCEQALAQTSGDTESFDARRARARYHFDRGVGHFDREEWQAALAEFLRSRELVATKANTKNSAICLRKVGRFSEALELFETLLRDFPDLPQADREMAATEVQSLSRAIGTVEVQGAPPGASVSVDGVVRGTTPLRGPLRLDAGVHVVRVVKDGALPFEKRVDLAGEQVLVITADLVTLTRAGRLRVTERDGKSMTVVVDGAPVGTTPWEGALAPGTHSVYLRSADGSGTPPQSARVRLGRVAELELLARPLDATLLVRSTPRLAEIRIDGVSVGRGLWSGKLDSGPRRVEVVAAGYAPFARTVLLTPRTASRVSAVLQKVASAPEPRRRVTFDLDLGAPIVLNWGGDLLASCDGPCRATVPFGALGEVHAAYQLDSRLSLGIHFGYVRVRTRIRSRSEHLTPVGFSVQDGTVEDDLRLGGLLLGTEGEFSFGAPTGLSVRIGAGVLIGSITDHRSGTFGGTHYGVSVLQSPRTQSIYVAPELRWGFEVAKDLELGASVRVKALAPLRSPTWNGRGAVPTPDGLAHFPNAELTGRLLFAVMPIFGARLAY